MNYTESIEYLETFSRKGIVLGLEKTNRLLALLGNPHKKLKFIHVAGTNGKGSTCNYIQNIFIDANYVIGMYTSPYLYNVNECIRVNGQEISDLYFATLVSDIKRALAKDIELENIITKYELVSIIAILYFCMKKCDIVVLETGLGGTFDSTNVIKNPLVSVITNIGFDHTMYLGDTIESIAANKAGIFKQNSYVVVAPQDYVETKKVFYIAGIVVGAKEPIFIEKEDVFVDDTCINCKIGYDGINDIMVSLLGEHQAYNAATAIKVAKLCCELGFNISNTNIIKGIESTKWACRLQLLQKNPTIFVDGAHNEDGLKKTLNFFDKYYSEKKLNIVFGVLSDKNYFDMIRLITQKANRIYVASPNNKRALDASSLAKIFLEDYNRAVVVCDTVKNAVTIAKEQSQVDEILCVLGSLYVAAEAVACLKNI